MNDFYRTPMGHRFFEATLPSLVTQLQRIANSLDRLLDIVEGERTKDDRQTNKEKP